MDIHGRTQSGSCSGSGRNWGAAAEADAIDIVALEVRVHQTSAQRAAQCWTMDIYGWTDYLGK